MSEKQIENIDNIKIIYPKNYSTFPKDCPICKFSFRDAEDIKCFKEWECCTDCRDSVVYPNKEKWLKGWRPKIKNST